MIDLSVKTLDCLKFAEDKKIKIRKGKIDICTRRLPTPSLNFPVTVTQWRAPDRIRIVAGWRFIDWGSSVCPTLSFANIVHRLALGITDLLPHEQYSRGGGCSSKRTFEQDLVPRIVLFSKKGNQTK